MTHPVGLLEIHTYMCKYIHNRPHTMLMCDPNNYVCTSGNRGQIYLSFLADPAVLLCQSDQEAQVLLGSLAGREHHLSPGALVVLELPPPPWGTESWRCSKPSSL